MILSESISALLLLKWFWTIAAGVGVLVTGALFYMSIQDFSFLIQQKQNGWRRNVAITSILIYLGGFGTQLVYFIIGVISLTITTKLPADYHVDPRSYVTSGLLVFGAVSSIILAIIIYHRRRHILETIESYLIEKINKERDDENENPSSD